MLKAIRELWNSLTSSAEDKNIIVDIIGFEDTFEDAMTGSRDPERGISQINKFIETFKNNPEKYNLVSQKEFIFRKSTTLSFFQQAYLNPGFRVDFIVTDQKLVDKVRENIKTKPIFLLTTDKGVEKTIMFPQDNQMMGCEADHFYCFLTNKFNL